MLQFQEERLACAAVTVRPLQKVIDATVEYTKNRKAFGKPLLENQVKTYQPIIDDTLDRVSRHFRLSTIDWLSFKQSLSFTRLAFTRQVFLIFEFQAC